MIESFFIFATVFMKLFFNHTSKMQVWKFGGTSVGKPERMQSIRNLITEDTGRKIVVLSALSGTTNELDRKSVV